MDSVERRTEKLLEAKAHDVCSGKADDNAGKHLAVVGLGVCLLDLSTGLAEGSAVDC